MKLYERHASNREHIIMLLWVVEVRVLLQNYPFQRFAKCLSDIIREKEH